MTNPTNYHEIQILKHEQALLFKKINYIEEYLTKYQENKVEMIYKLIDELQNTEEEQDQQMKIIWNELQQIRQITGYLPEYYNKKEGKK